MRELTRDDRRNLEKEPEYGVRRRRGMSAHKSRSGELGELELVGVASTPKPDHNGMRACGGERHEVSVCVMTREPNVKREFRIGKRAVKGPG